MDDLNHAEMTQRCIRFFRNKGIHPEEARDLAQDTWVQMLAAKQRGSVDQFGIGFVYKSAWFIAQNHWRRASKVEEPCGDFTAETRPIQLYPEGGGEGNCRHHPNRPAVEGKTMCQECLDRLKAQASKQKESGMCRSHPQRPAAPGRTRCQACLDKQRERDQARRGKVTACA